MRKRGLVWIMTGALVVSLTGCAKSPENSVVREKNMDKMLKEAENADDANSYEQVKEEMKKYETYKTKIRDKKLKVTVDVDAKVEIPEVEKLSVYRVSAKKINQKFLDRVRKTLTPGMTYYDGSKEGTRTKPIIAKEIKETERMLAEAKKSEDKGMVEEYEGMLEELKEEYTHAKATVRLTDYPSDNKIHSIKKLHSSNPEDSFYDWLYELHDDGEVFYGLSDGQDGNYHGLYMQNCENYGNCLRYECNKYSYSDKLYRAYVENDIDLIVQKENGKEPDFSEAGMETEQNGSVQCVDNEPLTLSQEEAEGKVEQFLGKLGLDEYQCHEQGTYAQLLGVEEEDKKYREVYRFLCLRKLDGVFVDNQAGYKLTDEWQGNNYVKKMWGSEAISIAVNDSGIVDFYYLSPLSIDETVVEKSRIKSFDEIRDIFEQMVVIENAPEDLKEAKVSIKVTGVRLVYTRISEKNSFDTGLVVPVWNFEGSVVNAYGEGETGDTLSGSDLAIADQKGHQEGKTGTILSINAIDGSVINQELGY